MTGRRTPALLALAGLALGAVAVGVARAAGHALSWPVALAGGLVLGVAAALAVVLPGDDPAPVPPDVPAAPAVAGTFGDLARLRLVVEADVRDPARFEGRLRPRLTGLAVERLWLRHRLDWRTDEGRAAALALLGPELTALLTAPPGTLQPDPGTLLRWTRELEDL